MRRRISAMLRRITSTKPSRLPRTFSSPEGSSTPREGYPWIPMAIPREVPSTRTIAKPLCIFRTRSPMFSTSSCSAAISQSSNSRDIISSGGSFSEFPASFSFL